MEDTIQKLADQMSSAALAPALPLAPAAVAHTSYGTSYFIRTTFIHFNSMGYFLNVCIASCVQTPPAPTHPLPEPWIKVLKLTSLYVYYIIVDDK